LKLKLQIRIKTTGKGKPYKIDLNTVNALMGHTSYRPEYDHRDAKTILNQYKDIKVKIDKQFKVG
jgi:hypothetical protein